MGERGCGIATFMLRISGTRLGHNGQSLVELVVGLIALVPVMLVIFDIAVLVLAVQQNDSICREAARAAAAGDPSAMRARATAIVSKANLTSKGIVSNYQLISVTNNVDPTYLASISQFGGPINGNVTVVTQVDVRPFVVQWVYAGKSPLQFQSKQTIPFTYQMPNISGAPS